MTRLMLPVGTRDHILGSPGAAITLVEYGHYECAHCAQAHPIVMLLRRQLNGNLRYTYRHFPRTQRLSITQRAAEAVEAAGAQGKFWEMHWLLLEHTHDLSDATIGLGATALGLDMPRFLSALKQGIYAERVREDFESGLRSGVSSTPTFFINGDRHDDYWDADTLFAAMERRIAEASDRLADCHDAPGAQSTKVRSASIRPLLSLRSK